MAGDVEGVSQSPLQGGVILDYEHAHPVTFQIVFRSDRYDAAAFLIFTRAPGPGKAPGVARLLYPVGRRAVVMRCARVFAWCLAVVASPLLPATAIASCGWSRIDHRVTQDESGIWNPD